MAEHPLHPPRLDLGETVKEVLAICAISFLLAIMLLGMKTLDRPSGLELQIRWDLVLAAVLSTGIGRYRVDFAPTAPDGILVCAALKYRGLRLCGNGLTLSGN